MTQSNEIMPETEKLVVDWANYHRYAVNPRKWRVQEIQEIEAMHKLGIFGADFGLGALSCGKDEIVKRLDKSMIGDEAYKRSIYVPRGLVVYGLIEDERRINSEQDLEEFLKSGELCNIVVDFYLGNAIENWKSDRVTEGERKRRASASDYLIVTSDGECANGHFCEDGKTARERVAELLRKIEGVRK